MQQETKIILDQYKKQFKNYEKYIAENDWTKEQYLTKESFDTEASLVDSVIKNLSRFIDENEEDLHLKDIREFFKESLKIIDGHTKRIESYLEEHDWAKTFQDEKSNIVAELSELRNTTEPIKGLQEEIKRVEKLLKDLEEDKRKEINFQKTLFDQKTKAIVSLSKLNITDEDNKKSLNDLLYAQKKAPLLMREFLCKHIPVVSERTKGLDINWESPNPATSKEMFINMKPKDIPPYNPNKHFFEQPTSTIQFWEEEINKIRNGININGFHLSPWLYWHSNFFFVSQGKEENKQTKVARIRDNEYFFDHMWRKAREKKKEGLLVYGSRRIGKSVMMASHTIHKLITIQEAKGQLVATNSEDLKNLKGYMTTAIEYLPDALGLTVNVNSEKEFKIGVKKTAQNHLDYAILNILNLDSGKSKGTQKTAGGTPDVVVFDEIGKHSVLDSYEALRPALENGGRTTALLAGTGNGNEDMSKDAEQMLRNYEIYGILPMDWDFLEEIADPEYYTWKRTNFSMFVPAQLNLNVSKNPTNLQKFLKSDNEELSKIEIDITDWKKATENVYETRRLKATNHKALTSEVIFHPIETDEVFMSAKVNPFDAIGCKNHKQSMIDKGLIGTKVRLRKDEYGNIQYNDESVKITNEPTVDIYPYKGGSINAPFIMYEMLDKTPPFGMYVIGLDDVKHDKSNSDSVLSATCYKRGIELDEWADRIVCSYDTRPEKKDIAYKDLYLMMKYYNAIVFPENEDNGFVDFLERNYPNDAYKHLANSVDFANAMGMDYNKNRRVGYNPTGRNNKHLNNRVIAYTQEDVDAKEGEESELKTDGYKRIPHLMLLEEMINYKEGANADRIRSFGMALIYAEYLDKNHMYISRRKYEQQQDEKPKKKVVMNKGLTRNKRLKKW